MSDRVTNIVVAGLGGQGVVKASDIIADAAFRGGYDVKKAEIHGMSQRGGSVTTDVRFGKKVLSPMVSAGEADYLLVLSPDQVENNLPMLNPKGILIQPELAKEAFRENKRSLNIVLVGILSRLLELPETFWREALKASLPPNDLERNIQAFELGRKIGETVDKNEA